MATELIRFTQWAREKPQRQYNALMGMLMDPQGLNASFERQAGSKAPGVDGMRKADYAVGLLERLADLAARLRRLGYRPKPVRRVYIPKANAGRRALGVPTVRRSARARSPEWDFASNLGAGVSGVFVCLSPAAECASSAEATGGSRYAGTYAVDRGGGHQRLL